MVGAHFTQQAHVAPLIDLICLYPGELTSACTRMRMARATLHRNTNLSQNDNLECMNGRSGGKGRRGLVAARLSPPCWLSSIVLRYKTSLRVDATSCFSLTSPGHACVNQSQAGSLCDENALVGPISEAGGGLRANHTNSASRVHCVR
jgi:hypothetical protein